MPNAAVKNMETPKCATMRPDSKTDRASIQSFLLRPEVSFAKVSAISDFLSFWISQPADFTRFQEYAGGEGL